MIQVANSDPKETYMKIVVIRSPRAVRYILSKIFNVEIKKEHK